MAFSAFRISLIVFVFFLLIVGIVLIYASQSQQISYLISTPTDACQINYNSVLTPSQNSKGSCAVSKNDWVVFHLKSQFNVTVTIWLNSNSSSGAQLVYNATNTKSIAADFPIFSAGSLNAILDNNQEEANTVLGNLSVMVVLQVATPAFFTTHPYRDYGLGIATASLAALFLLVWNPGNIAARKKDRPDSLAVSPLRGTTIGESMPSNSKRPQRS
ncbi:MAG: hypothetical protein ACYC7D_03200 [Nitrososphaerales archaeon]